MRKKGYPQPNEMVVCKITKLHPNSAYAQLIEYDKVGMVHVSEVAKKWVRDIREFLKEGQYAVCRVMKIEGDYIILSVKRVHEKEAQRKLSQFNKEKKAEKILELAAGKLKKTLDDAYEKAGYAMVDNFGSLTKALEFSVANPSVLQEKGIPKDWADMITELAKQKLGEKQYTVKAMLNLISYSPEGVLVIKQALSKAKDYDVKYISAPRYMLSKTGKNFKQLRQDMTTVAQEVCTHIERSGGTASFEMIENG